MYYLMLRRINNVLAVTKLSRVVAIWKLTAHTVRNCLLLRCIYNETELEQSKQRGKSKVYDTPDVS